MYKYNSKIKIQSVALNSVDFSSQIDFYTRILGMDVISNNTQNVKLGIEKTNTVLVELNAVSKLKNREYGLYHIAILLPTRKYLGQFLFNVYKNNYHLVGVADHGYSEAIYLNDSEGNGIEVYCEKDVSEWDIREDGKIVGITEMLDIDALLSLADKTKEKFVIPNLTTIGHIHLSVKNSQKSSQIFQKALDFDDKFSMPSASFLASGNYHHQIAVNQWSGQSNISKQEDTTGLKSFNLISLDIEQIKQNLKSADLQIISENKDSISFIEENGIVVNIYRDIS